MCARRNIPEIKCPVHITFLLGLAVQGHADLTDKLIPLARDI